MGRSVKHIVLIGAGVGGLASAALLARAGFDVTVLEAHVYPGGCAGTFYHRGYRFDAGATLAGGFDPGGVMARIGAALGIDQWPAQASEAAMQVHLPDGAAITRWGDARRHAEHESAFGRESRKFFEWQEAAADALWDFALRNPAWPPQTPGEAAHLLIRAAQWIADNPRAHARPGLALDALRPVAAHLPQGHKRLRLFVDGQLLISAQATSREVFALYGAAALDLPRRGVAHLEGGIGAIAGTLAGALIQHGGRLLTRQEVRRIRFEGGWPVSVETKRGEHFPADLVIANLNPWSLRPLLGAEAPARIRDLPRLPRHGWGASMLYLGVDDSLLPPNASLHHQVLAGEPLGEGNSVFLSFSPAGDAARAPVGQRALTISTHTRLDPWWALFDSDRAGYEARKAAQAAQMLATAERAFPGLHEAASIVLPGSPVTFQRFTRRAWGWVGGFPQTSLFTAWGPRIRPGLWMVGDSIFPGQSIPAVALGGIRVAQGIIEAAG